jgi:hypothetical protein
MYELLRITKTGSGSLVNALETSSVVITHGKGGHRVRLENVPAGNTAIISIRDPIERCRSGFDMTTRLNNNNIRERYPTIDLWVEALRVNMYNQEWGATYLPQVQWTGGAAYMRERKAIIVQTNEMTQFINTFDVPGIRRNIVPAHAHPGKPSRMSPHSAGIIEEIYAADYAMLRGLGIQNERVHKYNGKQ